MARNPPKQLDPERRDWLRRHVAEQAALWRRIVSRMDREGFDPRSEEYRRATDVLTALSTAHVRNRPRTLGLWMTGRTGEDQPLTAAQIDAITGTAAATIRDLAPAIDYFAAVGSPCRLLAAAVRRAVDDCESINMLAGKRENTGGNAPEPPADPAIWLADGI